MLYRCITGGPRCRTALSAAMLSVLVGCQSAPPRIAAPGRVPPQEVPGVVMPGVDTPGVDTQPGGGPYDWRGLLIAPFGTLLKAIPLALHEVLLFRDEAHVTGAAEDAMAGTPAAGAAECYAADVPAPPFAGRTPDEYVLCFKRDRLARIQASVKLTAAEAPHVFAAACAAWSKNAAPDAAAPDTAASGAPAASMPSAESQTAQPTGAACEGRDGEIRFSGRLGEEADRSELPPTESMMSITLDSVSAP